MRAVIQRVQHASVTVESECIAAINKGLLVLLGIEDADDASDIAWLSGKIINMRIFADEAGLMNRSIIDTGGEILLVSQFTLHASTRKGARPSFIRAAKPPVAIPLFESMTAQLEKDLGKTIAKGVFGADMQVALLNDGPVTIIIDTKNRE